MGLLAELASCIARNTEAHAFTSKKLRGERVGVEFTGGEGEMSQTLYTGKYQPSAAGCTCLLPATPH